MSTSSGFALTVLLLPLSVAQCTIGQGSCMERWEDHDKTSLVQIKQTVTFADERQESSKASERSKMEKEASKKPEAMKEVSLVELGSSSSKLDSDASDKKFIPPGGIIATLNPQQSQLLSSGAVQVPMAALGGLVPGLAPTPTDYHYNSMTISSQVSPGGANDDPKRAAARAAQAEEHAERAMENAVWKAQQEERAAMFASKRAAALRAAAEKAASAENQAARSQIQAADALEASAVRQAATDRSHARVAAYKSIVQQATAYQAAADQTFAAQRAAAARSAAQSAARGLHTMQEDTEGSDYQFNDRDAHRSTRHRYHDAMDNVNMDRQRFHDMDADEEYETDSEDDDIPFNTPHGPRPGARRAAACAVGDMVAATYAGDGRQYQAKVGAINHDGTVTVSWLDGFAEGNMIPGAQVFKGNMPCGAGAAPVSMAAAGAGQPMVAGGMGAMGANEWD